ncbi:DUF6882 domain-containing protein [Clavibacter sp. Sh2036]|uniref:DUF6882 domain-containing protein n=1 Tax=unclassified Clavibacter TaxID=2626594 RepID=UPI0022EAB393|nr:DUF6882 domain-containing protein [Clavibacter sp. CT19]MDA3803816.1 hypothetical protein [Clavibacter sp. CT19]
MTESPELTALVDAGAFLSLETQLHLVDLLGDYDRWDMDMRECTLMFRTGSTTRVYPAQLLGTAAGATWLAAWANPSAREGARRLSEELAELGRREPVPELASDHLMLDDWPEDDAVHKRLAIAVGVLRPEWRATYTGPTDISKTILMLCHPDLELPAPTLPRTARVLAQGLDYTLIRDHRVAVEKYAAGRGIPIDMGESRAVLTLPDGVLTVEFDPETSFISRIAGGSEDAPPEEAIDSAPVARTRASGWLSRILRGAGA